jgi:stage II sporulation protein D
VSLQSEDSPSDKGSAMCTRSPLLRSVVLVTLTGLAAGGCAVTVAPPVTSDVTVKSSLPLPEVLRVRTAGRILSVRLDDYVLGSALSEVSPVNDRPDAASRIFEVQAVMARTYAVFHIDRHRSEGFDLCDGTHCQLYQPSRIASSRFTPIARAAVARTSGQVLVFGQRPVQALFHADCGGHTAAAEVVWGGRHVSYLPGVPDHVPAETHRRWRFAASAEEVRGALNQRAESVVGRHLEAVTVTSRDASGRAEIVELRGQTTRTLRGEQLRAVLNHTFGPSAIRSPRFSVARRDGAFVFEGTGHGHGVGLCQVGAAARARRGESLEAILAAYYPGTRLTPRPNAS